MANLYVYLCNFTKKITILQNGYADSKFIRLLSLVFLHVQRKTKDKRPMCIYVSVYFLKKSPPEYYLPYIRGL